MRKWVIATLLALLLLLVCTAYTEGAITSLAQLNAPNMKIGVGQGSTAENTVRALLPEAEILVFNGDATVYLAVAQGKIDAYVYDRNQMRIAIENGVRGVHLLDETLGEPVRIAVGISPISRIPALEDKINVFIGELRADGTLDDMFKRWVIDGNDQMPDIALPENADMHMTVGTSGIVPPFSYYAGTELTGYDIELARRFAAWLGADLRFKVYDYGAIIAAAAKGDVDCVMANLNITPERAEALTFSDWLYEEQLGILVKGDASDMSGAAEADTPAQAEVPAYTAYNGKRLGVLIGPLMEDTAAEFFPDSEYLIFNSYPDCIAALMSGKIDAYLGDEPSMKMLHAEQPQVDYIHDRITENNYSFAFRKNDAKSAALCKELNDFLARSWADGTMQELDDIWFGTDESKKVVDMSDLTGENGTIKVVTTSTDAPFSYIKDGKNVGYDIDLVVRFCRDRGYALELGDVDFAGRIPAIESGKYDFTTDMNVTPEREEQVLFSDPTSKGGIVLAVRASDLKEDSLTAVDGWYHTPQDLTGKRIAVQTGTISGEVTQSVVPNVLLDYYNSQTDAMTAVKQGKADAWATDEPMARFMLIENTELYIADQMDTSEVAAVFARTDKGQTLCNQYSAFVDELWADGTMEVIQDVWFGADEDKRTVLDYESLPAINGTLRIAVDTSIVPFAYVKDNRVLGYDVDIAARFCEANGYRLEVVPMSFDGVLPSVQTGKCDFAACCITVTEERAETVLFSSPNYHSGTVVVLRKEVGVSTGAYTSLSQLNGKHIGVQTGTSFDAIVSEILPEAQIDYYNTKADLVAALMGNKVDGFVVDEPVAQLLTRENAQITYLPEYLDDYAFAFVFPKTEAGEALRDQFNAFLRQLPEGTLDALAAKWFGEEEDAKTMLDIASLIAENGTLRLATESGYAPFEYVRDGAVVGYDMELAALFCEACGYGLEIVDMNFDGILPSVQTRKCDFAAAGINITPEREESVLFSEPNYTGGTVMAVLKSNEAPVEQTGGNTSLSDLSNSRIGVATGTSFDEIVRSVLPDATISYINSSADLIASLEAGKIDGFAVDEPASRQFCAANARLAVLDEYLDTFEFGFVLPKTDNGERLLAELDAWLVSMKESGALEQVIEKWANGPEDEKTMPDYAAFPAPNGKLTLVTEGDYVPLNYYRGNEIVGAEIDLAAQFCEARGYGLEVKVMNFDGILPAVQTGKADLAAAGISITDERRESVNFSVPYYAGGTVMVVLKGAEQAAAEESEDTSFWGGIKSSFNKTFIREGRWKLFLQGVLTTLLITALTILFGTALGFLVFMLCRNGNPVANLITRFSLWLVQGMPMVVLLMILYYIIFGSVAINGIVVAVIGFTLTFGAVVYGLLKIGVGAVDNGQYEAAYALGYTNTRTFFRIILPQALPHVLPAYKGEIVGLIKASAIVGYIAVQDLTKMGDIVRSRTYEAFFPLIAVTVIYFLLEGLLGFLVSRISINFNPKRRKPADILKGVKTDD